MSKAKTLDLLSKHAECFVVDPFLTFTVGEWRLDRHSVLQKIFHADLGPTVIVRSSTVTEDTIAGQPPGTFESTLDVPLNSPKSLSKSITRVIESYKRDRLIADIGDKNEVIVQRQLLKPLLSGVLSSRDISSREPYYIVEYDDISGRTDAVTSGKPCKRVYIFRKAELSEWPWDAILRVAKSIERILASEQLFIEFAVSDARTVHVFQARQMRASNTPSLFSENKASAIIRSSKAYIDKRRTTVWSDMADWNPAEMLGDRPHPLDISLYEYLITDENWTNARATLGYRNVQPRKLMQTVACKPFIDVEASFLSLTPNALPIELARRLVDNRIKALHQNPELHDKVELELLYTCADVAIPRRTQGLRAAGFSKSEVNEIEDSLCHLTAGILTNAEKYFAEDAAKRRKLLSWFLKDGARSSQEPMLLLDEIRRGLMLCRDLGVFPFARLARMAFLARDLIERLIVGGAFSRSWADAVWKSIETVAAEVADSVSALKSERISRVAFNERYGHLRPRTYDITSPRYDQIDFGQSANRIKLPTPSLIAPDEDVELLNRISSDLLRAKLPHDVRAFMRFVSVSFKEREQAKFDFTIVLSHCIESIARLGEYLDLTRQELSYLSIKDIFKTTRNESLQSLRIQWSSKIVERQDEWEATRYLRHPSIIFSPTDLYLIKPFATRPNFITSAKAVGHLVHLTTPIPNAKTRLDGNIVAIDAADPGYDWVFSHRIVALVTKFGGAASHMAVRCAEFGIPAAVGCGYELFQTIVNSVRIEIDCAAKEITSLE